MLEIGQLTGIQISETALTLILIWTLIWTGLALWKAARSGSKVWFIILLVVNTFGILEIIYLFAVKPRMSLNLKAKEEEDTK